MGNIEKYGVLALIFVIVLILAVAICNGPGDTPKPGDRTAKDHGVPGGNELELRENVRKVLEEQVRQRENVTGPVAQPNGTPPQAAPVRVDRNPQFKTYVVKKDDTLESIAKAELGSRTRWQDIVKANESLDPRRLRPGQSLLLPVDGTSPAATDERPAIKPATKSTKAGATPVKSAK